MAFRGKLQSMTSFRVNTHNMNRIAERKIRTLQEITRKFLTSGNNRCPKAVTHNLWPYALRMANDVLIKTSLIKKE